MTHSHEVTAEQSGMTPVETDADRIIDAGADLETTLDYVGNTKSRDAIKAASECLLAAATDRNQHPVDAFSDAQSIMETSLSQQHIEQPEGTITHQKEWNDQTREAAVELNRKAREEAGLPPVSIDTAKDFLMQLSQCAEGSNHPNIVKTRERARAALDGDPNALEELLQDNEIGLAMWNSTDSYSTIDISAEKRKSNLERQREIRDSLFMRKQAAIARAKQVEHEHRVGERREIAVGVARQELAAVLDGNGSSSIAETPQETSLANAETIVDGGGERDIDLPAVKAARVDILDAFNTPPTELADTSSTTLDRVAEPDITEITNYGANGEQAQEEAKAAREISTAPKQHASAERKASRKLDEYEIAEQVARAGDQIVRYSQHLLHIMHGSSSGEQAAVALVDLSREMRDLAVAVAKSKDDPTYEQGRFRQEIADYQKKIQQVTEPIRRVLRETFVIPEAQQLIRHIDDLTMQIKGFE